MSLPEGASEAARATQKWGQKSRKILEERGILSCRESMRDFVFLEQSHAKDVISFWTYRPEVMNFESSVGRMDGFGASAGKIDGFGTSVERIDGFGASAGKIDGFEASTGMMIVTGYQSKG